MEVDEAIPQWMERKLTTKEVFMATGYRSVKDIYMHAQYEIEDIDNAQEYEDMNALLAEEDQQLYEQAAYEVFDHYLQENPEGLSQCVKALRRENYLGRKVRMGRR